jgi:hypothetical protein
MQGEEQEQMSQWSHAHVYFDTQLTCLTHTFPEPHFPAQPPNF